MNKSRKSSVSSAVLSKVKHLRYDKIYDYGVFENIQNKDALKNAIARLFKDEIIVKVGRAKFYKKGKREVSYRSQPFIGKDSEILKRGYAKVDSFRFSQPMFWSNPHGSLPIENIISKVILSGNFIDIDIVRRRVGDNRVKEVFLNNFDIDKYDLIRDYLDV